MLALLPTLLAVQLSAAPAQNSTLEAFHTQCLLNAADPKNPWALAHGIVGTGKNFAASDGRRAADVIVHDFLKKTDDPKLTTYSYDRYAPDGTPIEPHTNLNTKTLVLAPFPLSTTFDASFGRVTLQQMVDGIQRGFHHVPQSEDYWKDVGWTLDMFAALYKPGKTAVFKNGAGETIDLNVVFDDALTYLEKSEDDLLYAMDHNTPSVPKRKQGIYGHPCGGLHLVQAVANWARYPEIRKKWGKRWDRQVQLLYWRLGSESGQYDAALQQAPPAYHVMILTQMVKFYGHLLETLGRMQKDKSHTFTAAEKQNVEKTKALLDHALRGLEEAKAFEQMDQLKASQHQVYLDLIGDSCHASHGLQLWQ